MPWFPEDDQRRASRLLETSKVLRSDDYGHSWRSIAKGLPSDFGFPIVVHPHDVDTVYVVPLEPATRQRFGAAKWRRVVEPARAWAAEETALLKAKYLTSGHTDGTEAVCNANQQVAVASELYEKALREFMDFRPASRAAAS
jgi:hypothetical protein